MLEEARLAGSPRVRPAAPHDLPAIVGLCGPAQFPAFKRADPVPQRSRGQGTEPALFSVPAQPWCLLAESGGEVIGYTTYTLDFSTWRGAAYMFLDCLFVAEEHRGGGRGRRLLDAVIAAAVHAGATAVQWQTPDWNSDAIRFYDRTGAQRQLKARYLVPLPVTQDGKAGG